MAVVMRDRCDRGPGAQQRRVEAAAHGPGGEQVAEQRGSPARGEISPAARACPTHGEDQRRRSRGQPGRGRPPVRVAVQQRVPATVRQAAAPRRASRRAAPAAGARAGIARRPASRPSVRPAAPAWPAVRTPAAGTARATARRAAPLRVRVEGVADRAAEQHPHPRHRVRVGAARPEHEPPGQADHADQAQRRADPQPGHRPAVRDDLGDPALPDAHAPAPAADAAAGAPAAPGAATHQAQQRRALMADLVHERRRDAVTRPCARAAPG